MKQKSKFQSVLLLSFPSILILFLWLRIEVILATSTNAQISQLPYPQGYSMGNGTFMMKPDLTAPPTPNPMDPAFDSVELSEEDSEEDSEEISEEDEEDIDNYMMPPPPTPHQTSQIANLPTTSSPLTTTHKPSQTLNLGTTGAPQIPINVHKNMSESSLNSSSPTVKIPAPAVLPVRQKDEPGLLYNLPHPPPPPPLDVDDTLLVILQNAVRETYLAFKSNEARKKKEDLENVEDNLKTQIQNLDIDLNAKILAIDTNSNSRIATLTEQIVSQRKEDILTFSDNLNQLSKANQVHLETLHAEAQHMKVTVDALNKAQASLSTKMSQIQKTIHSLESKINEITMKGTEDYVLIQTTQKTLAILVDSMEKDLRSVETSLTNIQGKIGDLEKAKTEDNNKLRKTIIRDQKKDPIETIVKQLRNKNVGKAMKHWEQIEQISEDLKETLPSDMAKIIEDAYSKNPLNLAQMSDFVHRAVSHGERRLKEAAYSTLINKMEQSKHLSDRRRILEVFNVAQHLKTDLGSYVNSSSATAEILSKLPEVIRLVTFEKVKLFLPSRGYLRVSLDRKVSLVPKDARFYDMDEILFEFEFDKDKSDGSCYIKSHKLQKYLVTIHESFNSYGFSRQALFMTGNRKENGTRFDISNINGDHVLLKSIFYNGFITWKSNIQTIYGDDDSYFVLLADRKNGPSAYWIIEPETDFSM